ncbi:MAG: hypothetical protein V2I97_00120 [Desulfococcaceae bacterium]|jgi:putative CRISPR-associated protein (TIGR02619 family)|nr:hypothetical protein [Desulfococcaceae bacterium]
MTAMRIIAPVGLSLFSNYKHKGNDSGWNRNYDTVKDRNERACKYKSESRIATLKKGIEKFVKSDNASAEISSILKIAEKFPENEFSVSLLPSDTVVSLLAAELIKDSKWLENRCSRITKVTVEPFIPGLQVDNEQEFIQKGMSNLIQTITNFINREQDNLLINITGGYKATIPYLTIMGQIYNIPLYYTFEETSAANSQLIRIPQAPVDFDFTLFDEYYDDILKSLKKEEGLSKQDLLKIPKITDKDIEALKEADHIEDRNGQFFLTLMGKLILNAFENIRSRSFRNDYSKLRSDIIEYKVFEYYVEKYPDAKVVHSRIFEENKRAVLESDIFVELDNQIISVEVKPAKQFREIEKKFEKGNFNCLPEQYRGKTVTLEFVLYSYIEMNPIVIEKIKSLHNQYHADFSNIKWYKIDHLDKYKKDSHWKITDQKLTEINL